MTTTPHETPLARITTFEELRVIADHTLGLSPLAVMIQCLGETRTRSIQTCDPPPESRENWWWMESLANGSEEWYTDGELLHVTNIGEALEQGTLFVKAEDATTRRAAACAAGRAYHLWCNTCLRDYYVPVAQGFNCPKDEEHDTGMIDDV